MEGRVGREGGREGGRERGIGERMGKGREGGREGGRKGTLAKKEAKKEERRVRRSVGQLCKSCSLCLSSSDMIINDDLHVLGGGEGGARCVVTWRSRLKWRLKGVENKGRRRGEGRKERRGGRRGRRGRGGRGGRGGRKGR